MSENPYQPPSPEQQDSLVGAPEPVEYSREEMARIEAAYTRSMWIYRAYWTAWVCGSILIALSWVHVVSRQVGWVGFCIAGAATLLSMVVNSPFRR